MTKKTDNDTEFTEETVKVKFLGARTFSKKDNSQRWRKALIQPEEDDDTPFEIGIDLDATTPVVGTVIYALKCVNKATGKAYHKLYL